MPISLICVHKNNLELLTLKLGKKDVLEYVRDGGVLTKSGEPVNWGKYVNTSIVYTYFRI